MPLPYNDACGRQSGQKYAGAPRGVEDAAPYKAPSLKL